jgi:thymidylate kinase
MEFLIVTTVSFSGIDGAGKTTQLRALESWLQQAGLRVELLTFWDNIVAFPQLREFMSHYAFKGDQGVGTPEKPLHRRDKNVNSWPLTTLRFCFYLADAISLCWKARQVRHSGADVVIFDRYIYDELANLPLNWSLTRIFVRLIMQLSPKPDIALVIDADPVAARARKPEYPLEFLRINRAAYLALSRLTEGITVIEPLPADVAGLKIRQTYLQRHKELEEGFSGLPALP